SAVAVLVFRYVLMVLETRRVPVDSTGELRVGAVLGDYRLERRLGRGGGGTVYLATELGLRRKVAIKGLNPELPEDPECRKQFLQDRPRAAALTHPTVVTIYRAGEANGRLFVAMQWVRGSLAELLRRDGRLAAPRAVSIVEQAAAALDAAHELGLVH